MKYFLLIVVFSFINLKITYSQQLTITLSDVVTKEPIPYANICINTLDNSKNSGHCIKALTNQKGNFHEVTNTNGQASFDVSTTVVIGISCIGYKTIVDTIPQGTKNKTYNMEVSCYELSSVVVTGHSCPVSIDKSVYDIKLISKEQIESKAAVSLADVLSGELNVKLENDPSTGTGIKLQGISDENIKILIDGVPVIGRVDGKIDLSQINLNNVDHIEIIEGPMSVVYGSNALGGVINIITNKSVTPKFNTTINSYYESIGSYNINANVLKELTPKHSLELSVGRNFFAGYDIDESNRSLDWKPKEQYNAGLVYAYKNEKTQVRYKSNLYYETLLNNGDLYTSTDTATILNSSGADTLVNYQYTKANDIKFYTTRFNNTLEIEHKFNEQANFKFHGAYSWYNREKLTYIKDMSDFSETLVGSSSNSDTSRFDAVMLRGIYNYTTKNKKMDLQSGFDINLETGEGERILDYHQEIGDYAAFINAMYKPIDNFTFQPGVRAIYNTKYDAPLTPSINLMYKPGNTNIRASWAMGFRAPSLKELYMYFYDSNHQIEGNENLKAERSNNAIVSVTQQIKKNSSNLVFEAKVFYNNIKNRIILVQVDPDNALHYSYENTSRYESMGIECNGTAYLNSDIILKAGYSRTGIQDYDYGGGEFIYSNNVNGSLSYTFWKNSTTFSTFYKFTGNYPFYFTNDDDEYELGQVNAYHNLDASIAKRFWDNRILCTLGAKNIFDNKEVNGKGTSATGSHGTSAGESSLVGWGRTYYLSLKFNFVKY